MKLMFVLVVVPGRGLCPPREEEFNTPAAPVLGRECAAAVPTRLRGETGAVDDALLPPPPPPALGEE